MALLPGTGSGNDRLGTRVQGLPWAAGGVAQALLPVLDAWNASALGTGKSACATTPPGELAQGERSPAVLVRLDDVNRRAARKTIMNCEWQIVNCLAAGAVSECGDSSPLSLAATRCGNSLSVDESAEAKAGASSRTPKLASLCAKLQCTSSTGTCSLSGRRSTAGGDENDLHFPA